MSWGHPNSWSYGVAPQGEWKPSPAPRRSKLPLITLLTVCGIAVAAFIVLLVLLSRPTPSTVPPPPPPPPTSATPPTPSAVPTPTEQPSPQQPTDPTEPAADRAAVLAANPLYAVDVPATSCPQIDAAPTDVAGLESYGEQWMTCLGAAWQPVLTGNNGTWTDAGLAVFESATISTACGAGSDAFYCSADNTIYIGNTMAEMTATIDSYGLPVSYFYIMTHEYHHHVQNVSGIIDAMYYEYQHDPDEGMRRLELQDQCWVSMSFRAAGLQLTPAEQQSWLALLSRSTSQMHGDSTSTVRWGTVGLSAETMAACSTWTAPSEHVT